MCYRKRRLEAQQGRHLRVLAQVVIDSITAADHSLGKWLPGNPNPGRKVVAVRIHQAVWELCAGQWPSLSRLHRRYRNKTGRHIKIDQLVIGFSKGRGVFITQAEIEGQAFACAPVVLDEKVEGVGMEVIILRAKLD